MTNCTILIDNTDDKLTRREWYEYNKAIESAIYDARGYEGIVDFHGFTSPEVIFVKTCWVFTCDQSQIQALKADLAGIAKGFKHDAITFMINQIELVSDRSVPSTKVNLTKWKRSTSIQAMEAAYAGKRVRETDQDYNYAKEITKDDFAQMLGCQIADSPNHYYIEE